MSTIATELDTKLAGWEPKKARQVSQLVADIIALADRETQVPRSHGPLTSVRKADPFFSDRKVHRGRTPKDLAVNQDAYLYGRIG